VSQSPALSCCGRVLYNTIIFCMVLIYYSICTNILFYYSTHTDSSCLLHGRHGHGFYPLAIVSIGRGEGEIVKLGQGLNVFLVCVNLARQCSSATRTGG
jgi:hypothetical protein